MESTQELSTIEEYASEVKEAVASCESVDRFSDHLLQKDFITRQRQSDILYNASLTPLGKAGRLVDAVLFQVKTNPSKFEVFVEILEKQPPLKDLAAQLRLSYAQSQAQPVPLSGKSSGIDSDSDSDDSVDWVSSLESQWALLIATLVEILSNHKKALMKMKSALEQRVISKSVGKSEQKLKRKFTPVIGSPEYKEAKAVDDFFRVLAPYWNWKEYGLLEFMLRASGCQAAIEKLQEFIASRQEAAPHIVLQLSHAEETTPGEAISSLPLSAEEPCPGDPHQRVVIVMKVNRDELTLQDYDQDTSLLCRVVRISRNDLALLGTGTGCIAIKWMISPELAEGIQRMTVTDELLRELAQRNIVKISIGPNFHLSTATVDYWHHNHALVQQLDMLKAAYEGNLDEIQQCLTAGMDVDMQDDDGWTALMCASRYGHREIAQLLVDRGADVNTQEKDGWTALMLASRYDHREIAQLLVYRGADVNTEDKDGWTALMLASRYGHREIAQLLVDQGANVNTQEKEDGWTALMCASMYGHREIAQLLVDRGADVNTQEKDGWTALMLASRYGHREIAQLLVDRGADVNTQEKDGWTALMLASRYGHREIVQLLVDRGTDINTQKKDGWTALMLASRYSHREIAQLLVDRDADVNTQKKNGRTALMLASMFGHREIAQLLVDRGADVNTLDDEGWTSLMFASEAGHTEIVLMLLELFAEINVHNVDGLTALDIASSNEQHEIYQILALNGAVHGTPTQPEVSQPPLLAPIEHHLGTRPQPVQQIEEILFGGDSHMGGLLYRHDPPFREMIIPPDQEKYDPTSEHRLGEQEQH